MTAATIPRIPVAGLPRTTYRGLQRHRGLLIAMGVFVLMTLISITQIGMSYYDMSTIVTTGAPLAIAAVGQTLVILSGGLDLSAGAVVSLVNVVLASQHADTSPMVLCLIGVGVGMLAGVFNAFFIAVLRMPPIVVTLSTMFILQGITLLISDKPGGAVPAGLGEMLIGDVIPGVLPKPVLLIAILLVLWAWLKNTRFGMAVYAIGSEYGAARAAGVSTRFVQFALYVIAGGCYGLAGVFISAQTGSGDPLIGAPMLLQMFAAVVIGGTVLSGGRGGPLGTVFGAYILMMVVNTLLILNVSAYYSTIAEGGILILAVLAGSLGSSSPLARNIGQIKRWFHARGQGMLVSQSHPAPPAVKLAATGQSSNLTVQTPSFWTRHAETLKFTLPAYVGFLLIVIATPLVLDRSVTTVNYYNSIFVLASFLVVLSLGQGAVILTNGLDLSIPWTIGFCGILLAGIVKGSDSALLYALPITLLAGALVGLINGAGIVVMGVSPIVMTLAMNGILQGVALIYSNGTPDGFASPLLRALMTSRQFVVIPVVLFVLVFITVAVLLLGRTTFGRSIYAVGNGMRVAQLSGVKVKKTIVGVYVLSGLCSAIAAVLLTGLSGQASLGMGDEYLLPSIAVVVIGGTLIVGGRGHFLGMLGGVLLLTALQILLAGTMLSYAYRAILFGLVVLVAVIGLREKRG